MNMHGGFWTLTGILFFMFGAPAIGCLFEIRTLRTRQKTFWEVYKQWCQNIFLLYLYLDVCSIAFFLLTMIGKYL